MVSRDYINGAYLSRFINKPISIMGKIDEISNNGLTFQMTTTDDVKVQVTSKSTVFGLTDKVVEVHGISLGRTIRATHIVAFDNNSIDNTSYNTLCDLLFTMPNLWDIAVK